MVGLDGVEESGELDHDESGDLFTIAAQLRRVNTKASYTTGC
jgi:hypothetical protein